MENNMLKMVHQVKSYWLYEILFLGYFHSTIDSEAPIIVCDCIAFLRNRGLQEVGLFRIPGNADLIQTLQVAYNDNYSSKKAKDSSEFSVLNEHNPPPAPSDVASLLKSYFKSLNQSLIPENITKMLIKAVSQQDLTDKQIAYEMSKAIMKMPEPNRELLSFLISFLREISTFKKYNNMGPDNLATCFVLSIMGHGQEINHLQVLGTGAVVIKNLINLPVKLNMPKLSIVQNNTKFSNNSFETKAKLTEWQKINDPLGKNKQQEKKTNKVKKDKKEKNKKKVKYKNNGTRIMKNPIMISEVVTNGKDETLFDISKYKHVGDDFEEIVPPPLPPVDDDVL